ncbi:DUF5686 family protein [Dinghuibacter silviterrae]|uniref:Carboxypeptidase-like protein n=1 Tax=Dinghuibacter silviterrae TaxID=1539049 RepID=A0A4V3GKW3_9BACT|nr:DUF5686 family protein [Dinghuibacter silviterrae]TDW97222.1 carboxypeptidase-like protein [Dinghuibacter silviterrae]
MSDIRTLIALIFTSLCLSTYGQVRVVSGVVVDSTTKAPLPNVSIKAVKGSKGTLTDSAGQFSLAVDDGTRQIIISSLGYSDRLLRLTSAPEQHFTVRMGTAYKSMGEVVVKWKKSKYRNKNNPAVELIREVIDHKDSNQVKGYPYATYREYERMQVSMDNIPKFIQNSKLLKQFHFLFENVDTVKYPGKRLIPIYLSETLSDNYFRRQPEKKKTIIVGQKSINFGEYIDMKGISNILTRMYEPINIYDNNISLFTTQFLSPVAGSAPTFYMYFIQDTIMEEGIRLVRLNFLPRNPDDLLFKGTLFVTLDGRYAIKKATLEVSKHVNLNYVRGFRATQGFSRDTSGRYFLTSSDMIADFGITNNGVGAFGERAFSYSNYRSSDRLPDSLFKGPSVVVSATPGTVVNPGTGAVAGAKELRDGSARVSDLGGGTSIPVGAAVLSDSEWAASRTIPLTNAELRAYSNIDSLTGMKSYKRIMDYATLLVAGYKQAGPFEVGPFATFYTFNPVEGFKPRFGGRSTTRLSKRYYVESYVAYGTKDDKWKYYFGGTYSINHQSIYKYPLNYVTANFQRDTRTPGQMDGFNQESSYSSLKRGDNTKWLYNDIFKVDYVHEFGDHLSYDLGFRYWQQHPGGSIAYVYELNPNEYDSVQSVTTTELNLTLRWAPHEEYYQGKVGRVSVANRYPIITLRYAHGFQGLMNGQYNYDALHLNVYKRVYMSPIGYSDVTFDAGWTGGKLPFPLLTIHTANQGYAYYIDQYNLMNFEEFVSDHYAGVDIDHYFNGFFFNKIPLLKWLKLREVIAGKILFGGVRDENNPAITADQMKFPTTNGVTSTYTLNNGPYIEVSAGVTNIFKLVRIDFVKRLTYLNHPDIATWGIRARVKFDF